MAGKSRIIVTNQNGPHENLRSTVQKHLNAPFLRPIADHTKYAFETVQGQLQKIARPIVLDACCGVGDSSRALAQQFPNHWVIGVDKSEHRLQKERVGGIPENLLLIRADLNDFYRLAAGENWRLERHYILYPNPWPKAAHLGRRWHGAPVFADMLKLGGRLELRSNWKLYLEEFQVALGVADQSATVVLFEPDEYLTPFEKKYHLSGQALWQLICFLDN